MQLPLTSLKSVSPVCVCLWVCMHTHICLIVEFCPTLRSLGLCPSGSSVHGDSPGKNTGVGSHALLQGIFPYSIYKFSCSVVSNSLWLHGLQHAMLPCPSPPPRACSDSCLSGWWCHPTISSSVFPFSSCIQSFPTSGSFPITQFLTLEYNQSNFSID